MIDIGFAKAEYAVAYFLEMGIGCRRDPLEANVWYVRAADQGDERARHRLAIIRSAETGAPELTNGRGVGLKPSKADKNLIKKKKSVQEEKETHANGTAEKPDDKDCIVM